MATKKPSDLEQAIRNLLKAEASGSAGDVIAAKLVLAEILGPDPEDE